MLPPYTIETSPTTHQHFEPDTDNHPAWKMFCTALALAVGVLLWFFIIALFASNAHACSRSTQKLKPELREKLYQLEAEAKRQAITFKVICTERSQSEQNELFAKGRTTPGPKVTWTRKSNHLHGAAFDVAIMQGGKITWEPKEYLELGRIARKIGLVWGGDWKQKDYGHFELDEKSRQYENRLAFEKEPIRY